MATEQERLTGEAAIRPIYPTIRLGDGSMVTAFPLFENGTLRMLAFDGRLFLENKVLKNLYEVRPDFDAGFVMDLIDRQ